jgi:hypothetical protein
MDNSVKRTREKNIEIIADSLLILAQYVAKIDVCFNLQTEMLMERFRRDIGDDKLDAIFRMITEFNKERVK